MKHLFSLLVLMLSLSAGSAHAVLYNFLDMADGNVFGESAYDPLTLGVMSVDGIKNGQDAFAYLDANNAGLGVCGALEAGAPLGPRGQTGDNICLDSADDNVTTGELLRFTFSVDTLITNIWFNNNHDGGFGAGDMVNIDGNAFAVSTGYANGPNGIGSFLVAANTDFDVAFNNEQFYISAIEFERAVPAPGIIGLLGIGLLGFAGMRRARS